MLQRRKGDDCPSVVIRVPGPWKQRKELAGQLPAGFGLEGGTLALPNGLLLELELLPADREFPRVFRLACRRPLNTAEQRGLDHYTNNAAVVGPAGSVSAAHCMLAAGAGLILAGGVGVFIDNSLLAHPGSDWLELAANAEDPAAVFYAFVNVAKRGDQVYSYGMHVIGQRDGIVDQMDDLPALEDFLRTTSADDPALGEGDMFSDERGRPFCLRGEPDRSMFRNHPVNNPYGRWRLEPL